MKIYSITLVSIFLLPPASADDLAVGILINGGYHSDSDHCNESDHEILGGAFNEMMEQFSTESTIRRGLAQHRELFNCDFYCQGFPPGYCYMAYPMCGSRRVERKLMISELAMEKIEKNMAEAGLRKVLDDFAGPQTRLMQECKKAKNDIKKMLHTVRVSPGCEKLMHFKFDMMCLRVPTG